MIGVMDALIDGRTGPVVVVGVPTALGGHLSGMERTPGELRRLGLLERLRRDPRFDVREIRDAGDVPIEPGFRPDPDPRAKNRDLIRAFLPRERDLVAAELIRPGPAARLLVLGGDCTAHAGALAGIRAARPADRLAIAWFDAHGDFNTPDTTPSGNVWGMPFAMLCGRGDPDLVAACDGPTVDEGDASLIAGQGLAAAASRALPASRISHFGAGMAATEAGLAALGAWGEVVARRVDGIYIAFDADCLDASGRWAVTMPEPDGLSLPAAIAAIGVLRSAMPVVGFGPTGITLANGDAPATVAAIADLAAAALGSATTR
jgi:arginase